MILTSVPPGPGLVGQAIALAVLLLLVGRFVSWFSRRWDRLTRHRFVRWHRGEWRLNTRGHDALYQDEFCNCCQ